MMARRWLLVTGPDRGGRRIVERQLGALGLQTRLECQGFTLMADDDVPVLATQNPPLAIIGALFERQTFARLKRVSHPVAQTIATDPGGFVCQNFWGRYVAIGAEKESGEVWALRDPSGAVPVYWVPRPGLALLTSNVRLLVDAGLLIPRVDLAFVAAHLNRPGHHGTRTGLEEVTELLPGTMLTMGREIRVRTIWSPFEFIREQPVSAAGLRSVVERSIVALASCHERLLVTVSGGLDSSIIAASLTRSRRPVSLLTIATVDACGDERPWARLLADALGFALATDIYDHGDIDLQHSTTEHQPWLSARTFAQGYDRRRQAQARASGADAIFSGDGGDNVFCLVTSARPVIDRLAAEGLEAAFETARDIARLTSCSVPAVLRSACLQMLRGSARSWPLDDRFLSAQAKALAACMPWHPWLEPRSGVPPGKRAHIAAIIRTQKYQNAYVPGCAEAVLPLLSQPIIEACLSVPSWEWCRNGANRSLARAAFEGVLPNAIVHRRTKGGPDAFCVEIIERNRPELREMLLGGVLASSAMLDAAAIEQSLTCGAALGPDVHRILALVDAEAWMRAWSADAPDRRYV